LPIFVKPESPNNIEFALTPPKVFGIYVRIWDWM